MAATPFFTPVRAYVYTLHTQSHVLKADYDATDSGTLTLASLQEVVRTELAKLGTELKEQMDQLREHVQRLESKVDQLLQARERT